MISDKAFILAAGFGKRLRPHTLNIPKPMVEVGGESLIGRTIKKLQEVGVEQVIVNGHYCADKLEKHLSEGFVNNYTFLYEPQILDTGGGIKNGLNLFGGDDFFVLSGDGLWEEGLKDLSLLSRMKNEWDPEKMDILVALQPVSKMTHTRGIGDYKFCSDEQEEQDTGRIERCKNQDGSYMFTSIRINSSSIFEETTDTPFSYLQLLDKAEKLGRLYGIVHKGDWHHISTPEDLESVRGLYRNLSESAAE